MKRRYRSCVNLPDNFCYVCGKFTIKTQRRIITNLVKQAYHNYFGCHIGDQEKTWAPHICCISCYVTLVQWFKGKKSTMPFGVPMIWRESTNHSTDCYFCMTKISGFSRKNKHKIKYPDIPSAIKPVLHSIDIPIPKPPSDWEQYLNSSDEIIEEGIAGPSTSSDSDYDFRSNVEPHLITQTELNDLVRDLNLSKQKSELLGSRLQEWNLLDKNTKISVFRNRHQKLSTFYSKQDLLCVCTDVDGLALELGFQHKPSEWRLFIDSSKSSLKAVLLHNGNKKPSIPVAHAVDMKESYQSMSLILDSIKYKNYRWQLCGDLKVIGLLLGLQSGYTKYCCFLCLWDSRARQQHYEVKNWPQRVEFIPGTNNIKYVPLVDPKLVLLPPLHIKLGLMKQFVKALDKNNDSFVFLKDKFPKLSDGKLKEGIFVGPQIRKLIHDKNFNLKLNTKELAAWTSFKIVVDQFLGNKKHVHHQNMIEELLHNYKELGCRMSLKVHFLHSHLNFFPENLGAVSDEQGERFHQDINIMEHRYQGRWDSTMMGDFCWFLQREDDSAHKRKK